MHTRPNVCNPGGDEGGDHAPPAVAGVRQRVAHEGHAAALPAGVEHLGDAGLDVLVGVGETQIDAAQAAASELAQGCRPERLGFAGTDILPRTSRRRSLLNHRDRHDAAVLAHLHVMASIPRYGQSPSIGRPRSAFTLKSISPHSRFTWLLETPLIPIACARSPTERVETPRTQASCTTAVSAFGHPAGLQQAREGTALAQLGDVKFDGSQIRSR